MKKKITKKLTLSKETLRNLDNKKLDQVRGGEDTYYNTCWRYCQREPLSRNVC